ncbi:MAG: DUF11 domain-containing protein [Planctomycetes bacterium]|nr:DUF11 domain-containing protein [Planctomycetota bacterium]
MCTNSAPMLLVLCLGLTLGTFPRPGCASEKSTPARTAQIVRPTPEPPLVGAPPPEAGPSVVTVNPLDPPTPTVAIRVRVAATAAPGQELEYRICVTNRSRAAAHHVLVRNPLPANAAFVRATPEPAAREPDLLWRLNTLPPCACREIVLVLRPTGPGDVTNCARVQFEHGECVTTRIGQTAPASPIMPVPAGPLLRVRKTAPPQVALYEAIPFRIEVANTSNAPLTEVVMTDILPADLEYDPEGPTSSEPPKERKEGEGIAPGTKLLTWNLGTLTPGQPRVIEYRAIAKKEGTFINQTAIRAAGGVVEQAWARVTVVAPKLELKMTGPERSYVDRPAAYDLTVSNAGSGPAVNVVIRNPIPSGTTFYAASEGGVLHGGEEVRWMLGTLEARARRTLRLELKKAPPGEEVVNKAKATANGVSEVSAEVKTVFEGVAGLTATIAKKDPLAVEQQGKYTITLTNTGTADVTDVRVKVKVPAQMKVDSARGPASFTTEGNTLTFEPILLKPGQGNEKTYEVVVTAKEEGDVRFRVEITAKELTAGPLLQETSTTISK